MPGKTGTSRTFDRTNTRRTLPRPEGKPAGKGMELNGMKAQMYDGSRKIEADTRQDECLFRAPRPRKYSPEFQRQGKDLYIHTGHDKTITYYFYLWNTSKDVKDKVIPVSPATAERFLRGKGLICSLFPKSDPIATLYNWGYGIAEEF